MTVIACYKWRALSVMWLFLTRAPRFPWRMEKGSFSSHGKDYAEKVREFSWFLVSETGFSLAGGSYRPASRTWEMYAHRPYCFSIGSTAGYIKGHTLCELLAATVGLSS